MNKILKRDEYINEVYSPMMEHKEYEELVMLNESLIGNLFGSFVNLFKKDWGVIKGNQEIIDTYKELDRKLSGYTLMKLKKKDQCNQVRQQLVDFATNWYDYILKKAEKAKAAPELTKSMEFEEDTLKDNLENCETQIKNIVDGDNQMAKWAAILLGNMKNVINRSILSGDKGNDISDDAKKEAEEMEKQDNEFVEKEDKKMSKEMNDILKEIEKERVDLINNTGATAVKEDLSGNKAVSELSTEFENIKKNVERAVKNKKNTKEPFINSTTLGFKKLFSDQDLTNNEAFKTTTQLWDAFYTKLNGDIDKFKGTPGRSVQAMCISVNAFIKSSVYGDDTYKPFLTLMSKCAICSDGVTSYNLPTNGKKGKDQLNYFSETIGTISQSKIKNPADNKEIPLPDNFQTKSKAISEEIIKNAKKQKEESDKKYEKKDGNVDVSDSTGFIRKILKKILG